MSYTPILPDELVVGGPVKRSIVQRLDANDQGVPSPMVFLTGGTNTWTAPESKWYKFICTANGAAGGAAPSGIGALAADGGGAGVTGIRRIYVEKGTLWTATFTTVSNANCTFSDGSTTLSFRNGTVGGAGGTVATGFDLILPGGSGHRSYMTGEFTSVRAGGRGGGSIHGDGAPSPSSDSNGIAALIFGAGGSGASTAGATARTGGAGGPALIIIEG